MREDISITDINYITILSNNYSVLQDSLERNFVGRILDVLKDIKQRWQAWALEFSTCLDSTILPTVSDWPKFVILFMA